MRSIFWKGMLVFLFVILVAVGTVAVLIGSVTRTEFTRYAVSHSGLWDAVLDELVQYYAAQGSWDGLAEVVTPLQVGEGPGRGQGRRQGAQQLEYRVIDSAGVVVASTSGSSPGAIVAEDDLGAALPVRSRDEVVGYLLPSSDEVVSLPLDVSQENFLQRVRTSLWIAALLALGVALLMGGLLFRSITAPLSRLSDTSQAIARGDLTTRAAVRGRDEIAQLGTSFNQMAENLARAEEARRNQTADVAHELRTPLTVLRGSLEAMLDGVYAASHENLQIALDQVHTLSRLVEDLRLLALADAGKLELHRIAIDTTEFLRRSIDAYRVPAQSTGVEIETRGLCGLPQLVADPDRLSQVLGNLIDNALRYAGAGGKILVMAEDQGSELLVMIADDGPGLSPSDLEHVFDRFWRADQTRRRGMGGSGLGLAITRSLVEAHGGRIWAKSVEGLGSAFTLALPLTGHSLDD